MPLLTTDTIVAPATAAGAAAVAIVRLSGREAWTLAGCLFPRLTSSSQPRYALFGELRTDDGVRDEVLVLPFRGPHSYTGEDLVELHLHGNDVLVQAVVRALTRLGARPADPGEFTRRAFLNGKMDLSRAEAVAEIIAARSERSARGAAARLAGSLSERYQGIRRELLELLVHLEATIDFPDEDIETLGYPSLLRDLGRLRDELAVLEQTYRDGKIERDGLRIAIAGKPNAGKSSLMNCLLGSDRAIVTAIPGTTRDYLEESLSLRGANLQLYDTAGLRITDDVVEAEGIRRAREKVAEADLLLYVVDANDPLDAAELSTARELCSGLVVWIVNKTDTTQARPVPGDPSFYLSARSGEGVPALVEYLAGIIGKDDGDAGARVASGRQARLLTRCVESLNRVMVSMQESVAPELVVEDMREAIDAVGELTGEVVNDEVLGEIFSRFCIGK